MLRVDGSYSSPRLSFLVSRISRKKCFSRSLALVLLILDNTSFLPYRSLYQASRRRTALTVPLTVFLATCLLWNSSISSSSWEQGWRSGESARLPPMCPGFDSRTRRHMWAEFVGSLLCSERFFSGYSGFPLSSKTNI